MLLICVYTMHHFLIRWNHTCCVVTVLSTVIQQSKLSLSLFFVIFLRSKIQNICCIKNTDIFGYVAYIHESQKITHHLNALLWFPRHYEGLRGAYAHLRTLADLAASCWRLLKCIVCAAEGGGVLVRRDGVRVGRVTVKEGGWRCVEIFIYYFFTTA